MVVVPTSHDVTLDLRQHRFRQGSGNCITPWRRWPSWPWSSSGRRARRPAGPPRAGASSDRRPVSRTLGMFPLSTVLFPHAAPAAARLRGPVPGADGGLHGHRRGVRRGPHRPWLRGRWRRPAGRRRDHGPASPTSTELDDGRMLVMARGSSGSSSNGGSTTPRTPGPRWVISRLGRGDADRAGRCRRRAWPSAGCGRSSPELGQVPALPHDLALAVTSKRQVGGSATWRRWPHRPPAPAHLLRPDRADGAAVRAEHGHGRRCGLPPGRRRRCLVGGAGRGRTVGSGSIPRARGRLARMARP